MAQTPEPEVAESGPEPAVEKPKGSGAAAKMLRALASLGLQFLLMVGAVLVGLAVSRQLHDGAPDDPEAAQPAAETRAEKKSAVQKPAAKTRKADLAPARYFALDPPLVVNLNESGGVRYLQVNVEVMARDEKIIAAVQQNVPLVRNDLVQLLSDRTPSDLMSREGREKARVEAQAAVNAILAREAGDLQIESLLFTGFVVQ
jgi:flagellar FliL protein